MPNLQLNLPNHRESQSTDYYQFILFGDRGTCVWTTCLRLLPESRTAGEGRVGEGTVKPATFKLRVQHANC